MCAGTLYQIRKVISAGRLVTGRWLAQTVVWGALLAVTFVSAGQADEESAEYKIVQRLVAQLSAQDRELLLVMLEKKGAAVGPDQLSQGSPITVVINPPQSIARFDRPAPKSGSTPDGRKMHDDAVLSESLCAVYSGSLPDWAKLPTPIGGPKLAQECRPAITFIRRVSDGPAETWRIDLPRVDRPVTSYPNIVFRPGDRVTFAAGGCVQTGGKGLSWRRYVDPRGQDTDHLYHGLITIPGSSSAPTRIADVINHPLVIASTISGKPYLVLGYEHEQYWNAGYYAPDAGPEDQCKGEQPAWLEVKIEHR
jgi:hypothetical protein